MGNTRPAKNSEYFEFHDYQFSIPEQKRGNESPVLSAAIENAGTIDGNHDYKLSIEELLARSGAQSYWGFTSEPTQIVDDDIKEPLRDILKKKFLEINQSGGLKFLIKDDKFLYLFAAYKTNTNFLRLLPLKFLPELYDALRSFYFEREIVALLYKSRDQTFIPFFRKVIKENGLSDDPIADIAFQALVEFNDPWLLKYAQAKFKKEDDLGKEWAVIGVLARQDDKALGFLHTLLNSDKIDYKYWITDALLKSCRKEAVFWLFDHYLNTGEDDFHVFEVLQTLCWTYNIVLPGDFKLMYDAKWQNAPSKEAQARLIVMGLYFDFIDEPLLNSRVDTLVSLIEEGRVETKILMPLIRGKKFHNERLALLIARKALVTPEDYRSESGTILNYTADYYIQQRSVQELFAKAVTEQWDIENSLVHLHRYLDPTEWRQYVDDTISIDTETPEQLIQALNVLCSVYQKTSDDYLCEKIMRVYEKLAVNPPKDIDYVPFHSLSGVRDSFWTRFIDSDQLLQGLKRTVSDGAIEGDENQVVLMSFLFSRNRNSEFERLLPEICMHMEAGNRRTQRSFKTDILPGLLTHYPDAMMEIIPKLQSAEILAAIFNIIAQDCLESYLPILNNFDESQISGLQREYHKKKFSDDVFFSPRKGQNNNYNEYLYHALYMRAQGENDPFLMDAWRRALVALGDGGAAQFYIHQGQDYPNLIHVENNPLLRTSHVPAVNTRQIHESGITGSGVTILVIDSGFSPRHEQLQGKLTVYDGSHLERGPLDESETGDTDSSHFHGTSVVSTISSDEFGCAPGANVIGIEHHLNDHKEFIKILEWALNYKHTVDPHLKIIGLSFGSIAGMDDFEWELYNNSEETRKINSLIAELHAAGIQIVTSAGNGGDALFSLNAENYGSLSHIGSVFEHVYIIGASNAGRTPTDPRDDNVSFFSSRGGKKIKPFAVTPGSDILVATGETNELAFVNGTSFSQPNFSGVLALMYEANPVLSDADIRKIIEITSIPLLNYSSQVQGFGEVDAEAAVAMAAYLRDREEGLILAEKYGFTREEFLEKYFREK